MCLITIKSVFHRVSTKRTAIGILTLSVIIILILHRATIKRKVDAVSGEYRLPRVVLFGDSHTNRAFGTRAQWKKVANGSCWGTMLADHMQRHGDVLNRGFGGITSKTGLEILPRIIHSGSLDVSIVTVLLGSNDAIHKIPVGEYGENMRRIVHHLLRMHVPYIYLITAPPRSSYRQLNPLLEKYSLEIKELGKAYDIPVVDLYDRMKQEQNITSLLLHDGLHLSSKGCVYLFGLLLSTLQRTYRPFIPLDNMTHATAKIDHWRRKPYIKPAKKTSI